MKIGNFNFKNAIFLAPMAGVTDVGFRAIARFFGAELATTEMVSAKGLVYGQNKGRVSFLSENFPKKFESFKNNKSAMLLFCEDIENVKCAQLFGNDPVFFKRALELECLKNFDIIDINMGCPAPKIIKNNEGSALMKNINQAAEVVKACAESGKVVTVKFRAGFKNQNCVEFAKMCENMGASAITVHPRLASQGYGGLADYELLKQVKSAVKIPVIGSGDVRNVNDFEKMLQTGVDGVMIGRASWGNQAIFKILTEFKENLAPQPLSKFVLKNNFFADVLTPEDIKFLEANETYIKYICAKKHVSILRKYYAEDYLVAYMRKHMLWYASGIRCNPKLKQELALSNNLNNSLELLKQIIVESF